MRCFCDRLHLSLTQHDGLCWADAALCEVRSAWQVKERKIAGLLAEVFQACAYLEAYLGAGLPHIQRIVCFGLTRAVGSWAIWYSMASGCHSETQSKKFPVSTYGMQNLCMASLPFGQSPREAAPQFTLTLR